MKLVLLFSVLLLSMSSFGGWVHGARWNCELDVEAEGYRAGFVLGYQSVEGEGLLTCTSTKNKTIQQKVYLYIGGFQVGFSNARIRHVRFSSAGIGLADPQDFFGKYSVGLTAGASLDQEGNEYDAVFALRRKGFGLEVAASETKMSRLFLKIPLFDVFAGIKTMRFSEKPR